MMLKRQKKKKTRPRDRPSQGPQYILKYEKGVASYEIQGCESKQAKTMIKRVEKTDYKNEFSKN